MRRSGLDFLAVEAKVRAGYALASERYRRDDELEVTTENHRRLSRTLADLCEGFRGPASVLDLGCGTGRYFHCLMNVSRLVGMDISEEMLAAARNPVRGEHITVRDIQLIHGNAHITEFPRDSFDLIYSLGMFGHGCPVTVEICNRFYDWLRPGGKLLFNTLDLAGLPVTRRWRRVLGDWLKSLPLLGSGLRGRQKNAPCFYMTKRKLGRILAQTRFRAYTITSHPSTTPLWRGRHLECIAAKPVGKTPANQPGGL